MQRTLLSLLEVGRATVAAIVVPGGPEVTYRALRRHVAEMAAALAALGIRRGDRVAIVLPPGPEAIVSMLAAAVAGTAAPLNPVYTEDEFRFYFDDVSARALIVPPGAMEAARRAWPADAPVIEASLDGRRLRLDSTPAPGSRGERRAARAGRRGPRAAQQRDDRSPQARPPAPAEPRRLRLQHGGDLRAVAGRREPLRHAAVSRPRARRRRALDLRLRRHRGRVRAASTPWPSAGSSAPTA